MTDKTVVEEIIKKHEGKENEAMLILEAEGELSQLCIVGELIMMLSLIEQALNKLSIETGISFNELEEMIWNIRRSRNHERRKEK